MFERILIANRGEIAVRIARACRELGIVPVGIFSDADRTALHVRACDESHYIGPAPATASYLRGERIVEIARAARCEAIHPGYGFLSENSEFARAVVEADLVWIGPPPEAMDLMGSKIEAKRLAERSGVPTVPGYFGDDQSPETLAAEAANVGYPLLIKASAGGGGKGMRIVESAGEFADALSGAQREAQAAFGDPTVLLEKYLAEPRHIEVQVLGDNYGNIVHLGERECSIQRRHQKVFEESPSPAITPEIREDITGSALTLARAAGYANAGTVEFIFQEGQFYFLEMNTRLQVEHPVTEEATGLDLVQAQIRIAAGERLQWSQDEIRLSCHAMEARLYAEDPEHGFLPSTGVITHLTAPTRARVDAGVSRGDPVTPYYDPMIAKIITSGETRAEALSAMRSALAELEVGGVKTNLSFLRWLVSHEAFEAGNFSTNFIEKYYRPGARKDVPLEVVVASGAFFAFARGSLTYIPQRAEDNWRAAPWRQAGLRTPVRVLVEGQEFSLTYSAPAASRTDLQISVYAGDRSLYSGSAWVSLGREPGMDGQFAHVRASIQLRLGEDGEVFSLPYRLEGEGRFVVTWQGREYAVREADPLSTDTLERAVHLTNEDTLESPMPGKVLKVFVAPGDAVKEEQPLVIIEAMKMEFTVRAPHAGQVASVRFTEGAQVAVGDVLVELEK
jgi:3-methylcrotonyl-CoA carboxylase alpha subunit